MTEEDEIGIVSTYFSKAGAAAIKLSGKLKVGNKIHVKGNTTNFTTLVETMQIEQESIKEANPGDHVGVKVPKRVRVNDKVYLV